MNEMGALFATGWVETRTAAAVCVASVLAMVASAAFVGAQEPSLPERAFFEPVEVAIVNVEVVVTDRKNRPITGLGPDSFRLFDDDEPVEISHFYAARGAQLEDASGELSAVDGDPERQLHVVLFFDTSNLDPARKLRAADQLGAALEQIVTRADVMIASYDGALEVWQPFSREPQLLGDAMDVVRNLPSTSRINNREKISREMQRVAADTASEAVGMSSTAALGSLELESRSYRARVAVGFVSQLQEYASSTRTSVMGTLDALHQVVRATSALAGRKAVILVSDDLEVVPGQILAQRWEEYFPDVARTNIVSPQRETQQFDLGSRVEDLVKTANTHRVSLFAIGALDDRQLKRMGAESGGSSLGLGFGSQQHFGGARALAYISGVTGGRVVPNGSSLDKHLAGVLRELDSYYSLAFETQRAGDGRYHRLRVEVDHKKARLRYREGYRDRSHEDVLADQTVAAAVLGITDNRLKIALEVDPMKRLGDDRSEVPIRIRVPLNQLGLRATGSRHVGEVTVFMVVRDERGGSSRVLQHDFPLEIDNESLLSAFGQYADFVMGVVMRDGKHRLAVGVRDQFGNVDATATLEVNVGNGNG